MYHQEQLNQLIRQSLDDTSRASAEYVNRMGHLAVELVPTIRSPDCSFEHKELQALGLPVVRLRFGRERQTIPFDGTFAHLLPPDARGLVLDEIAPYSERCSGSDRARLTQLHDNQILDYLLDFREYDVVHEEYKALGLLEPLTQSPWVITDQKQIQGNLATLTNVALIHRELGIALASLQDRDHPLHESAGLWCGKGEFKGRDLFLATVIKRARSQIEKQWKVAGHRFTEAKLGVLPGPEDACTGLSWPEPIHATSYLPTDSPRLVLGHFQDAMHLWDANGFQARYHRYLREDSGAEHLSELFFQLQDLLAEATAPEGRLLLTLDRDLGSGVLNAYAYREARTRLKHNWVSLCWCYQHCFHSLYEQQRQADAVPLCSGMLAMGLEVEPANDLAVLSRWLDLHDVRTFAARLDNYHSKNDVNTPVLFETFARELGAFTQALKLFQPEYMPPMAVGAMDDGVCRDMEKILASYYRSLVDYQEQRRHGEALLAAAYTDLVGYAPLEKNLGGLCRDTLIRQTLYRLSHGDYSPLVGGTLAKLAEALHSEVDQTKLERVLMVRRLLDALPGPAELFASTKYLGSDAQAVANRYKFLRRWFCDRNLLQSQLQARLGTQLGEPDQREARYCYLGLHADRTEVWWHAYDRLIDRMDRSSSAAQLRTVSDELISLAYRAEEAYQTEEFKLDATLLNLVPEVTACWLGEEVVADKQRIADLVERIDLDLKQLWDHHRERDPDNANLISDNYPGRARLAALSLEMGLIDAAPPAHLAGLIQLNRYRQGLWDELFCQLADKNPEVPTPLPQIFSRRFFLTWRNERRVAPSFRIYVLAHVPQIYRIEMLYFHRQLCLVRNRSSRLVPGLRDLLEMFAVKGQQTTQLLHEVGENLFRDLRLEDPFPYKENYDSNLANLKSVVQTEMAS